MEKEFKNLIKHAYYAPEPERKQEFLRKLRPRQVSTFRMLLDQIPYIRPHVWILALLILAVAIVGAVTGKEGTDKEVALLMPLTAVVGMLENGRSGRYGMSELEMATRFSLRSLVFARMTILGILAGVVTAVTAPVISGSFGMEAVMTAETILIPYLITMIIGLHLERSPLGRTNGLVSVLVAVGVSTLFFLLWNSEGGMALYVSFLSAGLGVVAVMVLCMLTLAEQWLTVKNVEAYT